MSRRPSPTTIIACLALFFSLAGTGIAASRYIITSTLQIKPSVRRSLHGAEGARGPVGPQGVPGATGASNSAEEARIINVKIKYLEGRVTELEAEHFRLCVNGIGEAAAGVPSNGSTEALSTALTLIYRNCL